MANFIFKKEKIQELYEALENANIFPKGFSIENFMFDLSNNYNILRVVCYFIDKPEYLSGTLKDLFCAGGGEDLRNDYRSFDLKNKVDFDDFVLEYSKDDYQSIMKHLNNRFPNFASLLNYNVVEYVLSQKQWLLIEEKYDCFSDTFAIDGFFDATVELLIGEKPADSLFNPKKARTQFEKLKKVINEKYPILTVVE